LYTFGIAYEPIDYDEGYWRKRLTTMIGFEMGGIDIDLAFRKQINEDAKGERPLTMGVEFVIPL
jgi:hypothetical protein